MQRAQGHPRLADAVAFRGLGKGGIGVQKRPRLDLFIRLGNAIQTGLHKLNGTEPTRGH